MFQASYLDNSEKELIMLLDDIIKDKVPEGKTEEHFTGGYVQHLKHKTIVVLFFGYKGKNPDSVKISIDAKEIDLYYLMLKAKTMNMTSTEKMLKVSATERLAKIKEEAWGEDCEQYRVDL